VSRVLHLSVDDSLVVLFAAQGDGQAGIGLESNADNPVRRANIITGTNPATDTRLSSSKTAESAPNLCETCTRIQA
jgi:hypothetical protein